MYRRIELINQTHYESGTTSASEPTSPEFWKTGLIGFGNERVFDTWSALNLPRRELYKNCRFFFTEAGWRRYGRPTVIACQQTGQLYRVIRVKEASVDVVYGDEFQVAVRPRARRRSSRRRDTAR